MFFAKSIPPKYSKLDIEKYCHLDDYGILCGDLVKLALGS